MVAATGEAAMKQISFLFTITFLLLSSFTYAVVGDLSPIQVQRAQEQLKKAGLNPGPIDGILGPQTKAALRQFQAKHGLPETGFLDEMTLKAFGLSEEKPQETFTPDATQATSQIPLSSTPVPQPVPEKPTEPRAGHGSEQGPTATGWGLLMIPVVLGLVVGGLCGWLIRARIAKKHQEGLLWDLNTNKRLLNTYNLALAMRITEETLNAYKAVLAIIEGSPELRKSVHTRELRESIKHEIDERNQIIQCIRSGSPSSSASSSPIASS
jgi:hypothetical protein